MILKNGMSCLQHPFSYLHFAVKLPYNSANIGNVLYFWRSTDNKNRMFRYIKKYPVSLAIILLVIYLSFFKPPSLPNTDWMIPHFDKLVHMGMYFVMSGMLWWEFFRSHKERFPARRAWLGAFLCPVIFSGIVEILQEYCTSYRGGDWLDFLANTTGALLASLLFMYIIYPRLQKKAASNRS